MSGSIVMPRVRVAESYRVHESENGQWIYAEHGSAIREREVPVDFYLREALDVDIDDTGSVMAFVSEWGVPADPENRDVRDTDSDIEQMAQEIGTLPDGVDLTAGHARALEELGWYPAGTGLRHAFARYEAERSGEFPWLSNWAATYTRLWRMQAFSEWAAGTGAGASFPLDAVQSLNAALAVFAPQITLNELAPQTPTIYNAVAAQIANDLHEGAALHACQNENCKRTFTKQRGRVEKGSHRTSGVMYCSNACAKAQAQRELRRRRRKEQGNA